MPMAIDCNMSLLQFFHYANRNTPASLAGRALRARRAGPAPPPRPWRAPALPFGADALHTGKILLFVSLL